MHPVPQWCLYANPEVQPEQTGSVMDFFNLPTRQIPTITPDRTRHTSLAHAIPHVSHRHAVLGHAGHGHACQHEVAVTPC